MSWISANDNWLLVVWVCHVGVLLCRGNRLLTGSNTRWLRLWQVEALLSVKPQENVCSMENRSAAHCPFVLIGGSLFSSICLCVVYM